MRESYGPLQENISVEQSFIIVRRVERHVFVIRMMVSQGVL